MNCLNNIHTVVRRVLIGLFLTFMTLLCSFSYLSKIQIIFCRVSPLSKFTVNDYGDSEYTNLRNVTIFAVLSDGCDIVNVSST